MPTILLIVKGGVSSESCQLIIPLVTLVSSACTSSANQFVAVPLSTNPFPGASIRPGTWYYRLGTDTVMGYDKIEIPF